MPRIFGVCAAVQLAALACIAALPDPVRAFPSFLAAVLLATAAWLVLAVRIVRGNLPLSRRGVLFGFAVAIAGRALLLIPEVPLSDDLYRYLWDGRVAASGINPYAYAPAAPELAHLRDSNWQRVNHPDIPTIYPPLAQQLFRLLDGARATPLGVRAVAAAFDAGTMVVFAWIFLRRSKGAALAFVHGWCPLAILESAGGGHVDAFGIFLLAVACFFADRARAREGPRRSSLLAGVFLSASAMVKLFPAALAPAFLARKSLRDNLLFTCGAVLPMLLILPDLDAGSRMLAGLAAYAEHWHFNDLAFTPLVRAGIDPLDVRRLLAIAFALTALAVAVTVRDLLRSIGLVLISFLAFSPTVHPWYALWVAPFLVSLPALVRPAAFALVSALPISYVAPWLQGRTGILEEPGWNRAVTWLPPLLLLMSAFWKRALRGRS